MIFQSELSLPKRYSEQLAEGYQNMAILLNHPLPLRDRGRRHGNQLYSRIGSTRAFIIRSCREISLYLHTGTGEREIMAQVPRIAAVALLTATATPSLSCRVTPRYLNSSALVTG